MFTLIPQNRCQTAILAAAAAALAGIAGAAPYYEYLHAPVTEYMQLPKFCWGQFNDGLKDAQFSIQGCGDGANHYCEGLLNLQRAKKSKSIDQKYMLLANAKHNTEYTLGWLQRQQVIGTCSITAHVEQTKREIDLQYQIYHLK
jgi:hypothetical protein